MDKLPEKLVIGYRCKSRGEDSTINVLSSRVYSYNEQRLDKFHGMLTALYNKNNNMKVLLDYIATWVKDKNDLVIVYGANLGTQDIYGYYSDKDDFTNSKVLNFNAFLGDDNDLLDTIAHECAHMMADTMFSNKSNGYENDDQSQSQAYFRDAVRKIYNNTYKIMSGIDVEPFYNDLGIKEILNLNAIAYKKFAATHNMNNDLGIFLREYVLSPYYPESQIDAECFARLFQLHARFKDSEIIQKLLSPFSAYIDNVLNPKFMEVGLKMEFQTKEFSEIEKLYLNLLTTEDQEQPTALPIMDTNTGFIPRDNLVLHTDYEHTLYHSIQEI